MNRSLLLLLVIASCVGAQTTSHTLSTLAVTGTAPSARVDGATAYDSAGNQLFVFGGQDANSALNDLWSFSIARQQWSLVAAVGSVPPKRFGHTLIYDSLRRRLLVFAGQSGGFYSDVWAWDIAAGVWQQLARDGAGPPSRYGQSAIYDPRLDRMVISHGFTSAGRFDDTWSFDLVTNSWKNITPAGTRPTKRCLHHAVLDEKGNTMYLYGGCSSGFGPCPQDDLWALDLATNTWQLISVTPKPAGRLSYGLAFDAVRSRVVLYGGSTSAGNAADVWEYDLASRSWQTASLAGSAAARSRHETAAAGSDIYFFGGNAPGFTADLLRLRPTGLPRISGVRNAFSGAGDRIAPGEIISIYGEQFGPTAGIAGEFSGGRLPLSLSDVSVTINGVAAPLFYIRNDQINAQVPLEAQPGAATISVTVAGSPPAAAPSRIESFAPGLFNAVWNADLTLNTPAVPSSAGSIVVLFATGHGIAIPVDAVVLRIGGLTAPLLYAGPVAGTAGVLQINARIPEGLPFGAAIPVSLTVAGVSAQDGVTVAVQPTAPPR